MNAEAELGGLPEVEGVEHRFVDANGIRIHVAEAGAPDSPVVLLLHGWPQHWFMWRRVIAALAADFRLLAPDLRGFGWSEAPGHGYDPETFAADQVALLDALGIERAAVIGHDWGGVTCFPLGLRHPDRVERMLVLSGAHFWPRITRRLVLEQLPRMPYALLNAAPGIGAAAHRRGWTRAVLRGGARRGTFAPEDVDTYDERLRHPERARAMSLLYRWYAVTAARRLRGSPWQEMRLTVPARLVHGSEDRAISLGMIGGLERRADDSRLELVQGAGHFLVDEQPGLVIDRARRLLAEAGSHARG